MRFSPLARASAVTFCVFVLLVLFSRFSMSESASGAHGKKQSQAVCRSAMRRAQFFAEVAEQDESLVLAILHCCDSRAHAQAAKDLAEQTGVVLENDVLVLLEEQQDRLDELVAQLVERE
jgi:hypothetical protein